MPALFILPSAGSPCSSVVLLCVQVVPDRLLVVRYRVPELVELLPREGTTSARVSYGPRACEHVRAGILPAHPGLEVVAL